MTVPTPEQIGYDPDTSATVRENVEQAISALADHVDDLTQPEAEEFVFQYVAGAGPKHASQALETTDTEGDHDTSAALFMDGDSPYAADNAETRAVLQEAEMAEPKTNTTLSLPTGILPIGQLDALTPDERRRHARNRGLEWPTTDKARDRLAETIHEIMRKEDDRVVDAPTSLGKTHTIAATRWGARDDITGHRPVVHLLQTRDARDEAIEIADEHGGEYFALRSRHEACPVAAGDYDPQNIADDDDREAITINGQPASEYIKTMCDGRGIHFGAAHRRLEAHNDQGVDLPCGSGGACPAIAQWETLREGPEDGDYWPLIIATHNFAYVPGLRMHTNIAVDEQPDYRQDDLTTNRVRRAISAFLDHVDCPLRTFEALIQGARDGVNANEHREPTDYKTVESALNTEPDREWYFEHSDAHTLAPALARAIFYSEERANDRRVGKTIYEPPRLDAQARDDDAWNRQWVTIVLDDANEVATVRSTPDFNAARSVIGLDAYPALPKWQVNTTPWIQSRTVLDREERRLWRRYERGLRVVQVGDATRPLTSGEYFDYEGTEALVEQLRDAYEGGFRTAITADAVEGRLKEILAGYAADPETMHYGEEKSRNDFAGEPAGLVNGCIDPGDGHVLNLLAELDCEASPERSDPEDCDDPENAECDHCDGDGCRECLETGLKRSRGRGFTGEDADTADAILASVRENHTAQAAGRYARDPDDPEATATVYVRTDAMPAGFADVQVPGVVWTYSAKEERVIETLRKASTYLTSRQISDQTGVSKRHVHRILKNLVEHGVVEAIEGVGPNGATIYTDDETPKTGIVDLTNEDGEIVTSSVWASYTWSVSIQPPVNSEQTHELNSQDDEVNLPAFSGGTPPPNR
ncbi:MAG: helix-turn-helix transcriptional regulator [Halobacteriales archaeon]